MTKHTDASWLVYALGALCVGAIIAAFLVVGPPSQSAAVQSRTVKAQQGVVQQTVSGSGNVEPATQLNLGFKTSGVVRAINVSAGQYVTAGQLLAELNPQSAEAALEQSKASLQAAEAALAQEEEDGGESSGAQSGAAGSSTKASAASVATQTQATTPASGQPARRQRPRRPPAHRAPSRPSSPEPSSHKDDIRARGFEQLENVDELANTEAERRHARSQPRLRASRCAKRQARRAERRTGGV